MHFDVRSHRVALQPTRDLITAEFKTVAQQKAKMSAPSKDSSIESDQW